MTDNQTPALDAQFSNLRIAPAEAVLTTAADPVPPVMPLGSMPVPTNPAPPSAVPPPSAPTVYTSSDDLHRTLVQAIQLLTAQVTQGAPAKSVRYRNPEPFDGSFDRYDPFLQSCFLAFDVAPQDFHTDTIKVSWLGSFLVGAPQKWFMAVRSAAQRNLVQPDAETNEAALMMENWPLFLEAFAQFADPDPVNTTQTKLDALRQTGSAAKYASDYQSLVYKLPLSQYSRVRGFYQGLKDPVKDVISAEGPADNLADMIKQAVTIDNRLHARRMEGQRPSRAAARAESEPSAPRLHDRAASTRQAGSRPPLGFSKFAGPPTTLSTPTGTARNSDGKLRITPETRKFRFDNNLCLRCGKAGHLAASCGNSRSIAAATIQEPTTQNEATMQGNEQPRK